MKGLLSAESMTGYKKIELKVIEHQFILKDAVNTNYYSCYI